MSLLNNSQNLFEDKNEPQRSIGTAIRMPPKRVFSNFLGNEGDLPVMLNQREAHCQIFMRGMKHLAYQSKTREKRLTLKSRHS